MIPIEINRKNNKVNVKFELETNLSDKELNAELEKFLNEIKNKINPHLVNGWKRI